MSRVFFLRSIRVLPVLLLASCGLFEDDESQRVSTATKLTSSTLSTSSARLRDETGVAALANGSDTCGSGVANCITPDSVTGMAYYAGMIVGGAEAGSEGISMGPILGSVADPSAASSFTSTELHAFDFSEGLSTPGSVTLGGPIPYPSDSQAIVQNAQVYFGWMDTKFTLAESDGVPTALVGTHYIRLVMADITDTDLKKGDLLYSTDGSTFYWCNSASCDQTERPSSPLQNSTVATYSNTVGAGNSTIPQFYALLSSGHPQTILTETKLSTLTPTFEVNFNMTNGVKFSSSITASSTTVRDMISSFSVPADPSTGSNSSSGFTADICITFSDGTTEGQCTSSAE